MLASVHASTESGSPPYSPRTTTSTTSAATRTCSRPFPACGSTARTATPAAIPGITDRGRRTVPRSPSAGSAARVILIPAHTSGHVAYHFADDAVGLHRRHALRRRLRPPLRGRRGADDALARPAGRAARRDAGLLRPRVHREEPPLRATCSSPATATAGREARPACAVLRAARVARPSRARSPRRRRPTPSSASTARSWWRRCAPVCPTSTAKDRVAALRRRPRPEGPLLGSRAGLALAGRAA